MKVVCSHQVLMDIRDGGGYDGDPHKRGTECITYNPTMSNGWQRGYQGGKQQMQQEDDANAKNNSI